jgi:hypothetical protein
MGTSDPAIDPEVLELTDGSPFFFPALSSQVVAFLLPPTAANRALSSEQQADMPYPLSSTQERTRGHLSPQSREAQKGP